MLRFSDQPRIFLGGTGRSGTGILAALFDLHPDVLLFPEPKIWMRGCGVLRVVVGKATLERFAHDLIENRRRNLVLSMTERGHEGADEVYSPRQILATLQWAFSQPGSRFEQGGRFIDGLFSLGLQRWGGRTWVDKTPRTIVHVNLLSQMFPKLRYLHIIREPKDIFASARGFSWGAKTAEEFVHWYNEPLREAWKAQQGLDGSQYMTLSLEYMVRHPQHVARMALEFAGLDARSDVIQPFAETVTAGRSHTGRWREELGADDIRTIDRGCSEMYQRWLLKAENDAELQTVVPSAVRPPR